MTMGMVLSVPLLMVGIWLMWRAGRMHGKAEA
jgi:prolipoprotein diacylglyceryltransferase